MRTSKVKTYNNSKSTHQFSVDPISVSIATLLLVTFTKQGGGGGSLWSLYSLCRPPNDLHSIPHHLLVFKKITSTSFFWDRMNHIVLQDSLFAYKDLRLWFDTSLIRFDSVPINCGREVYTQTSFTCHYF